MKNKKNFRPIPRRLVLAIATVLILIVMGVMSLGIVMCMSIDDPFDALPIWIGERHFNGKGLEICGPSRYREFSILDADEIHGDIAIHLGLDDGKLAGIFSDGRIVIWDRLTNEIVAEFASYRSMLDFYAENP